MQSVKDLVGFTASCEPALTEDRRRVLCGTGNRTRGCFETDTEWFGIDFSTS